MIEIKIEASTGAEARQYLMDLLFNDTQPSIPVKAVATKEQISEDVKALEESYQDLQKLAESREPKKRQTKAEKQIAEAANSTPPESVEEKVADDIQEEAPKESAVTVNMLQAKSVELIRGGKKEMVVAVIKKFGGDSISQADKNPLKVEDYSAVMDELNKL